MAARTEQQRENGVNALVRRYTKMATAQIVKERAEWRTAARIVGSRNESIDLHLDNITAASRVLQRRGYDEGE